MGHEMTDEVAAPVAVEPAPAPEVTATPEAAASNEPEAKPAEPSKTFSQEEVDAMVGKRLAREQRKWEREQAVVAAQAAPPQMPAAGEGGEPDVMALATHIVNQREAAKQQAAIEEAYQDRAEAAREKYDDFEQVAYSPTLAITAPMAATIRESEVGPEIAYYLGSNPAEARRIAALTPLSQARELGKLETKLASNPPAKRTSSAPAPIAPIAGRGSASPTYDTTDPRSIASMSTTEWINKERERQMKKLAGNSTSR